MIFLGHVLSNEGIKVDPQKVKQLQRAQGQLVLMRSKVSLASWLLSKVCKEILKDNIFPTNFLKKAIKFEWTDKCKRAFQELMHQLTTTPILTLPIEGRDYIIYSDASKNGFGCVLIQEDKVEPMPPDN